LSEAPRAKAGPSTRGNAAEGEVSRTCAGGYRALTPRPTTTTPNARRIPTIAQEAGGAPGPARLTQLASPAR
jgi:hypothetical protein